jgi:hypothetical protein
VVCHQWVVSGFEVELQCAADGRQLPRRACQPRVLHRVRVRTLEDDDGARGRVESKNLRVLWCWSQRHSAVAYA